MTVTIPTSEAQYGYVVGRVIRALGDTTDADDKPDAVAATGKVTFTPKATLGRTTDYSAFIVREKIDAPLDAQGNLVRYEGATPAGIALTVGAYRVDFTLNGGSIPGFDIEVTAAHTEVAPLDLVTAAPYVPPSGVTVTTMLVPAGAAIGQVLGWSASGLDWVDMVGGGGGGAVSSVAGRTGAVVLSSADLTDVESLATDAELTAGLAGKADALGADDNYVTDAEKVKLANLSGTNTGDQDLSGYLTTSAAPELIRDTMGAALVAGANVTITPNDAGDSITIAAAGGGGGSNVLDTPWPSGSWMREPVMGYGSDNDWAYYNAKAHVFFVTHETTVDALRIYVKNQVAGSTVTIFVHDSWPSTGLPRNLVASSGVVSTDTAGWVTAILASPVTLAPGIYWLGTKPGATMPGATLSVGNPQQTGYSVGRAPIAGRPEGVITYGHNFSASYAETATFSGPNRMHTLVEMRSA